ncbi:stage III sporulation protein SpoIIIAB [Fuchsiella alkaliacetigena]|uniref:stage III sporulation protein SpoIIIAB n=1 Tax=Fuchsiella alkaliacetigena TaxID=957042 RepID=UPI00200B2F1F|nr:stage III sporulation protein SpoIIIAB [Fuchsiella alkaliacetigena]MCK8825459.1 stage III sporulation protein SpoIIIAB [Fuchsiella alkaliacetigena]
MLKLIGSLLVIIATSILGFIRAREFSLRVKQLRKLQTAFKILEKEILYVATPLPTALARVGQNLEEPLAQLFLDCQETLSNNSITADQAWLETVKEEFAKQTALTNEDREILINFGKNLGNSSREHQEKNLKLLFEQLKAAEQEAVQAQQQNSKKWRYFGVLTGLLIVILLY